MADSLEKLFGSPARVKILRFFLMNTEEAFTLAEISKLAKIPRLKTRKEINFLLALGFIKKAVKETQFIAKNKKIKKKREPGFKLFSLFPHVRGLQSLLLGSLPVSRELLTKRFKVLGRGIKFVALSGIFTGDEGGGPDIFVVGDNVKKSKLEKILGKVESEIGKELNYVLFDTNEFKYRQSMYDRFVLDILDKEHDVLIDNFKS
ncbi:hypothetical protein HYT00_03210 [Candidatus Giovannonibacteria bacterium]|nr:hypothetical protein [Candidatus Giovannonibacteria bacterium]